MIKSWPDAAWEDFKYWMKQDKKTLRRILQLLKVLRRKVEDFLHSGARVNEAGTRVAGNDLMQPSEHTAKEIEQKGKA